MKEKYEQPNKPEISGIEAAVYITVLGMKFKHFFDRKSPEMKEVFKEAGKDLKSQPVAFKEIIANTVTEFSSLVLAFQTEEKEQELKIKQKLSKSIDKVSGQLDRLELLRGYQKLQEEATIGKLKNLPREEIEVGEEEGARFKSSMSSAGEEKRKEARKRAEAFINELLS